jgi:hypothetical protein
MCAFKVAQMFFRIGTSFLTVYKFAFKADKMFLAAGTSFLTVYKL